MHKTPETPQDKNDYDYAKMQIEQMEKITFGQDISILIITDRLHGCARGLADYLENSTDITVDVIHDAAEIPKKKRFDFLIIVGYLADIRNYSVMKKAGNAKVIIYALDSGTIDTICRVFKISYKFDRTRRIERFVEYIRQI